MLYYWWKCKIRDSQAKPKLFPYLGPVVDGKSYCVHGKGMSPDEVATKIDFGQTMESCLQISNLAYVITYTQQQTSHNVFLLKTVPWKKISTIKDLIKISQTNILLCK